jgi:hypothetical protein
MGGPEKIEGERADFQDCSFFKSFPDNNIFITEGIEIFILIMAVDADGKLPFPQTLLNLGPMLNTTHIGDMIRVVMSQHNVVQFFRLHITVESGKNSRTAVQQNLFIPLFHKIAGTRLIRAGIGSPIPDNRQLHRYALI